MQMIQHSVIFKRLLNWKLAMTQSFQSFNKTAKYSESTGQSHFVFSEHLLFRFLTRPVITEILTLCSTSITKPTVDKLVAHFIKCTVCIYSSFATVDYRFICVLLLLRQSYLSSWILWVSSWTLDVWGVNIWHLFSTCLSLFGLSFHIWALIKPLLWQH